MIIIVNISGVGLAQYYIFVRWLWISQMKATRECWQKKARSFMAVMAVIVVVLLLSHITLQT